MDEYLGSGKGELVRQSDLDRTEAHINARYKKVGKASKTRTHYAEDAWQAGIQAGREALVGQDEVGRSNEENSTAQQS